MSKILKKIKYYVNNLALCLLGSIFNLAILWVFSNNLPDYKFLKIINHQFQAKFIQEREN